MVSRVTALFKGLLVSALIFGVALLIADCLECQDASSPLAVVVCAIAMLGMIGLQFRYLFGTFLPSIAPRRDEKSRPGDELRRDEGTRSRKTTVANMTINVSMLASVGIWVVGTVFSLYPPVIPLMFTIAGVTTVLLLAAARRMSVAVRASIGASENQGSRWRWIAFSAAIGALIVTAVAAYAIETLRHHPAVALLCGALGFAMTSCGAYMSGSSDVGENGAGFKL